MVSVVVLAVPPADAQAMLGFIECIGPALRIGTERSIAMPVFEAVHEQTLQ